MQLVLSIEGHESKVVFAFGCVYNIDFLQGQEIPGQKVPLSYTSVPAAIDFLASALICMKTIYTV